MSKRERIFSFLYLSAGKRRIKEYTSAENEMSTVVKERRHFLFVDLTVMEYNNEEKHNIFIFKKKGLETWLNK